MEIQRDRLFFKPQEKDGAMIAGETKCLVLGEMDAACQLGLSVNTLRKWRCTGHGPVYLKLGKAVKYRLTDLQAFIEKSLISR